MQLNKIKLAGFKSFVDPTIIPIPSQLTAIVGPNGCGKSNIIDATCWVMGESSAKYLRGESLTDVIFNGSSARKPVGQASVELVFDNQDGSLGGEYSNYGEISIRRLITRDGDSNYYLNGTRCRRRDIVDIFLGTGLGPRSYSIIGQNMIARIIEAKPDEMRIYLEEAAGVSKYKERRRETENRILHTKENLARLNDIRLELEKQLNSLKRQANAAEKFKVLKQEERVIRAQWLVIQWRDIDRELVHTTLQIQQQETALEAKQTEIISLDRILEDKREYQKSTSEVHQDVQRRYYSVGNEITRLEQEIRHANEKKQQWLNDIEQAEKDEANNRTHLVDVNNQLTQLIQDIETIKPELLDAKEQLQLSTTELAGAEEAMHTWQNQWDEFNQTVAKVTQTAEVEQTRIQHLEQRLQTIKQTQLKLSNEQNQPQIELLENEISELVKQIAELGNEKQTYDNQLVQVREEIQQLQNQQRETHQQLDKTRNQLQTCRGQQSSLEALQQTALGQRNNQVIHWLKQHDLHDHPRLAQKIEVEAGWEYAVEKVLGSYLQALCVPQFNDLLSTIHAEFKNGSLCLFATEQTIQNEKVPDHSLLSKIKSEFPLQSFLASIFIAENENEALKLVANLQPHESVITRDGLWFNASWCKITRDEDPAAGVFQREQELKQLAKTIKELVVTQENLEKTITSQIECLKKLEQQRDDIQKSVQQSHAKLAEHNAKQKMQQQRLLDLNNRIKEVAKDLESHAKQVEETQFELKESKGTWQQAMSKLETFSLQREQLIKDREQFRLALQACKDKASQKQTAIHQLEIRLQTAMSHHDSSVQTKARLELHLKTLAERKIHLQQELTQIPNIDLLKKSLDAELSQRLFIEKEMQEVRSKLTTIEQELRQHELKRQEIEREIAKIRDLLETLRVEWQGCKVKADNLLEQVQEIGFELESVLRQLPEQTNKEEWHSQLEQINQRINRLGAINLVAIEEYAICSERKEYLDKQYADLQEGLTTLENAIAKIDKETRARFKETFDKVNTHFQDLFPTIFGGGRAYLELTGDNLLDAGITVMACPPGKRNSTIHLLSGGEKAMTAIALVFSIFQLNPAPFCLLDEVDAPLDDANISRFCELVKKMSKKTQFIFISHNKLAIEMAEHLIGVTMQEPGVSRLVSVNVEEAVNLAQEGVVSS